MSSEMVSESRWNRRRKLLPNLRLKYPNNDEMQELARLAKVDEPSIFSDHICSIILDAHLNHASLRTLSAPEVRKILKNVMLKAQRLASALRNIDVWTKGSAYHAGMLLEYQIAHFQFRNEAVLIPAYVELLTALHDAASSAARLAKAERGPKGASGNRAFNWFIESLYMAAWQRRGKWTNYASADGPWTGSLLKALEILKPYLPADFFPGGVLGRSIEHIRKKLTDNITKNPSSPV
jgi:hypothetical protein